MVKISDKFDVNARHFVGHSSRLVQAGTPVTAKF
jgi:hypothetical protein